MPMLQMLNRGFDIVFSIIGLILMSPLMGVISVLIKFTSSGPVLHRGLRTGRYGTPFRIYKFRTMVLSAEGHRGLTTAKNDPRLTRIGAFLRKHKLDELPQLINVIKGEMSVVGPRPEMPEYTSMYSEEEQVILSVRPGITDYASLEFDDLASVVGSGNADERYMEEVWARKNQLRIQYVCEHTFLNDLKLIVRTIFVMFKR